MGSLHIPLALAGVISFGWFGAGSAQDSGRFPDDPREGHLASGETQLVSTGGGRTTCSYYYPKGDRIL